MEVTHYDLASFDETVQSWVSAQGKYIVRFGASVEDIRATGTYELGETLTWKVNDVLRPNRNLY